MCCVECPRESAKLWQQWARTSTAASTDVESTTLVTACTSVWTKACRPKAHSSHALRDGAGSKTKRRPRDSSRGILLNRTEYQVKFGWLSSADQPGTLRLGPVIRMGTVFRTPFGVRREAVVDELPWELAPRRGAPRREEARTLSASRRERRRHRGRRGASHRGAYGVVSRSGALGRDSEERRRV